MSERDERQQWEDMLLGRAVSYPGGMQKFFEDTTNALSAMCIAYAIKGQEIEAAFGLLSMTRRALDIHLVPLNPKKQH